MALKDIKFEKYGDIYELSRPQWGNHKARISAYPGLLDKVLRILGRTQRESIHI